jgi:hypothetical protein
MVVPNNVIVSRKIWQRMKSLIAEIQSLCHELWRTLDENKCKEREMDGKIGGTARAESSKDSG